MIQFVSTAGHRRTQLPLTRWKGVDFRVLPYHDVFRARRLPRATYVFSDMDRLGFWELELSARLYRFLQRAGMRVLNDPSLMTHRFALLRALKREGLNDFEVFRVEEGERPRRFPVFLRTQSAHRGTLSGLLHNDVDVEAAVGNALAHGIPRKELMLIEYCAEPLREGLFRKLSVYRIGSAMVPALAVHESKWHAKAGELGIADSAVYDDEYVSVSTNRYADMIRPAFEIANIDYGRADFGMVGDRPQVYEINTNPFIRTIKDHPFPIRLESAKLCLERMQEAIRDIDTPTGGASVAVDDELLARQRRLDRWTFGSRWTP